MSILLVYPLDDVEVWRSAIGQQAGGAKVYIFPEAYPVDEIDLIAIWNIDDINFRHFPNLKLVASLGAGVEHILQNDSLDAHVQVTRIVDVDMRQVMTEYIVMAVLAHRRHFVGYQQQQQRKIWAKIDVPEVEEQTVGVMGLGSLGLDAAHRLKALGLHVIGWSRTPKNIASFETFHGGDGLSAFLSKTHILICLLPDTTTTHGILNTIAFSQMPKGAYIINVARGGLLEEEDLLEALDAGTLSGAYLDVFRQEPLPPEHPFWEHEKILLTPHISSNPVLKNAAMQVGENYQRMLRGEPLLHLVDRSLEY